MMQRYNVRVRLFLTCFIFAILGQWAYTASAHVPPTTCVDTSVKVRSVKGIVVDPQDIPIPGALIKLRKDSPKGNVVAIVSSSQDGSFDIKKVRPGKYYLHVTTNGFVAAGANVSVSRFASAKNRIVARMRLWGDCSSIEIEEATKASAAGPSAQGSAFQAAGVPATRVDFCELVGSPERFHKKLIRTEAILLSGPEHLLLYEPRCIGRDNLTWVDWKGFEEAAKATKKGIRNKLSEYLKADHRARIRIVGTFESRREIEVPSSAAPEVAEIIKQNNQKVGFGHLGCCRFQIVSNTIEKAERVLTSVPYP